jgi:hypothetical protein
MEEDGRGKNGVRGKDEDDVTENERNSANPKTEGYLIGINPPCKRAALYMTWLSSKNMTIMDYLQVGVVILYSMILLLLLFC